MHHFVDALTNDQFFKNYELYFCNVDGTYCWSWPGLVKEILNLMKLFFIEI